MMSFIMLFKEYMILEKENVALFFINQILSFFKYTHPKIENVLAILLKL